MKRYGRWLRQRLIGTEVSKLQSQIDALEWTISRLKDDSQRQRRDFRLVMRRIIKRDLSPLPPIRQDGFRHDEVFLLGSSPSMLELSCDERGVIESSVSIAMNRYLVFWDMVGIWPNYFFLADSLGVGWTAFERSLDLILQQPSENRPTLFLEADFEAAVPPELPAIFFHRDDRNGSQLQFAESLDEPLFFHRGSLTSVLNLVWVLRLAPRIRLVGVDLNRPGTFFETQRASARAKGLFNPWDDDAKSQGVHATVANMDSWFGKGSMLDQFDKLLEKLRDRGVSVSSANSDSLLVKQHLCKFDPITTIDRKTG